MIAHGPHEERGPPGGVVPDGPEDLVQGERLVQNRQQPNRILHAPTPPGCSGRIVPWPHRAAPTSTTNAPFPAHTPDFWSLLQIGQARTHPPRRARSVPTGVGAKLPRGHEGTRTRRCGRGPPGPPDTGRSAGVREADPQGSGGAASGDGTGRGGGGGTPAPSQQLTPPKRPQNSDPPPSLPSPPNQRGRTRKSNRRPRGPRRSRVLPPQPPPSHGVPPGNLLSSRENLLVGPLRPPPGVMHPAPTHHPGVHRLRQIPGGEGVSPIQMRAAAPARRRTATPSRQSR